MFNLDIPAPRQPRRLGSSPRRQGLTAVQEAMYGRLLLKTILRANWFARLQNDLFLVNCTDKCQGKRGFYLEITDGPLKLARNGRCSATTHTARSLGTAKSRPKKLPTPDYQP